MTFVESIIGKEFRTNHWDVDTYVFERGGNPNIVNVFKIDCVGKRKHEGIIYLHEQCGDVIIAHTTVAGCLGRVEVPISRIRFIDRKEVAA